MAATAGTVARRRLTFGPYPQPCAGCGAAVTDGSERRRKDMGETLSMALRATDTAGPRFEALYRSCAQDVFAYVFSLLRDRSAAEDVTAAAFERAFRKRRSFNAR